MLYRAILCCAALILGLLFCLNVGAEPADADTAGKPLDIMQFMREQAASTRAAAAHAAIKQRGVARPAAARRAQPKRATAATPKALPTEAAASFAAQPPAPEVEVVASDEFNAIDRAGEAAPPETVGAPPAAEPLVQVVEAATFNAIDRKADEGAPPSPAAAAPPVVPQSSERVSWMQWLWSAVAGTFAALAAAARQLIG